MERSISEGRPRSGRPRRRSSAVRLPAALSFRYATGTDSRDRALFRSCFAEEVEVDFSDGFGQPAVRVDADNWVKATATRMESSTATQHMISKLVITSDDDDRAAVGVPHQ